MNESFGPDFYYYSLSPTLWFDSFSSQRIVLVFIKPRGFFFLFFFFFSFFFFFCSGARRRSGRSITRAGAGLSDCVRARKAGQAPASARSYGRPGRPTTRWRGPGQPRALVHGLVVGLRGLVICQTGLPRAGARPGRPHTGARSCSLQRWLAVDLALARGLTVLLHKRWLEVLRSAGACSQGRPTAHASAQARRVGSRSCGRPCRLVDPALWMTVVLLLDNDTCHHFKGYKAL